MEAKVVESKRVKCLRSENFNFDFSKDTGYTAVWGPKPEDDPDWCPFGPMIADIEVTTICRGASGKLCKHCYKSNTSSGINMSFATFKEVLDKFPKTLTQIAIGADAQCESNPDIWKMMDYCREKGIVPNITVADITEETAEKLAKVCGAVAVSHYDDIICIGCVKMLLEKGLKQVNIHQMLSQETLEDSYRLLRLYQKGHLKGLGAIVFLSLKKKGRGCSFNSVTYTEFRDLIDEALKVKAPVGFDSCTAHKFIQFANERGLQKLLPLVEPCESMLFSTYISAAAQAFPCSFCEGTAGWEHGIDVLSVDSYKDIWKHKRVEAWRKRLLENKRACPIYEV